MTADLEDPAHPVFLAMDKRLPTDILNKVLFTLGQAQFAEFYLLVVDKSVVPTENKIVDKKGHRAAFSYADNGEIEIIIAKQRNGPVGTVQLAFVKEYNKFVNLEKRFDDSFAPPGA